MGPNIPLSGFTRVCLFIHRQASELFLLFGFGWRTLLWTFSFYVACFQFCWVYTPGMALQSYDNSMFNFSTSWKLISKLPPHQWNIEWVPLVSSPFSPCCQHTLRFVYVCGGLMFWLGFLVYYFVFSDKVAFHAGWLWTDLGYWLFLPLPSDHGLGPQTQAANTC